MNIVMRLVAVQLEKLTAVSFKVMYIAMTVYMMLLIVAFKNLYGYAIGKTTYLCNMRSMHNSEGLIND